MIRKGIAGGKANHPSLFLSVSALDSGNLIAQKLIPFSLVAEAHGEMHLVGGLRILLCLCLHCDRFGNALSAFQTVYSGIVVLIVNSACFLVKLSGVLVCRLVRRQSPANEEVS
jgi:hypothetical protein